MAENDKHRARIFLHRGDLVQARAAWEAAVKDDRASGSQRELSNSLGNLGNTCALAGELEKADACYKEVLNIQRSEQDQHAIAHTLVNLGNLYIGADQPEKARPYYLEALDLLKPLNDHRALGILYHNLAMEEGRQQHWDEAVQWFQQALDSHRVVGNEEGLAGTYSQLGKTFLESGRPVEAERCFNNASEHFIKLGIRPAKQPCSENWPISTSNGGIRSQRSAVWSGCITWRWERDERRPPPIANDSRDSVPSKLNDP